jgi:molybdopterin biosynthesis enzyme MoaB
VSGYHLVALIFVHEINDDLTSLVKKIDRRLDESVSKHRPALRPGVFVILSSGDSKMQQKLRELAARGGVKHVVLTIGGSGVRKYNVANEAAVSVGVYRGPGLEAKVSANFALRKGELTRKKAEAIFQAVTRAWPG